MRPSSVEYWAWALRVRSVHTEVGQTLVQVRFMLLKVHRNFSWFIWDGGGGGGGAIPGRSGGRIFFSRVIFLC